MLLIINYILCIHLTSLSFNRADICVLIHQCDYDFPEVLVVYVSLVLIAVIAM